MSQGVLEDQGQAIARQRSLQADLDIKVEKALIQRTQQVLFGSGEQAD